MKNTYTEDDIKGVADSHYQKGLNVAFDACIKKIESMASNAYLNKADDQAELLREMVGLFKAIKNNWDK